MDTLQEKFEKALEFKARKGYEMFFLQISRQYPICIFGCGLLGRQIGKWLLEYGIQPKYFCDNNPELHGQEILSGVKCVPFHELLPLKDDVYVIVGVGDRQANESINLQLKDFQHIMRNPLGLSTYWCQTFDIGGREFADGVYFVLNHVSDEFSTELFEVLVALRMQDHVIDYPADMLDRYCHRGQYLVKDIVDYSRIRSYVDCGAYTGDSLIDFINLNTNAEYHCFEMDQAVFEILERNAARYQDKRIYLYPYGVGACEETVSYYSDNTGGSKISENGTEQARIVSLDSIEFKEKIDFIKMDIEGAEESAIKGARKLIKRDHPVLAISIYHNFSQFVNVIKMIKEIEPRYKIYIRHHKYTLDDTVCYAVYASNGAAERE